MVNGTVQVNWANASQRGFYVDKLTPTLAKQLKVTKLFVLNDE